MKKATKKALAVIAGASVVILTTVEGLPFWAMLLCLFGLACAIPASAEGGETE